MAFKATVIVTFVPLITDVTLPTCLIALAQIIFGGTRKWNYQTHLNFRFY